MPDDVVTPFIFEAGVIELRDSREFSGRQVAESGEPCVVSRYGKPQVAIVPLDECRQMKKKQFKANMDTAHNVGTGFVKKS